MNYTVRILKNEIRSSSLKYLFFCWTALKQHKPVSTISNIFPWKSPYKALMAVLDRDPTEYSVSVVINQ